MKTYTPTLDAAVLDRLRAYASLFADDFPQSKPALWAGVYLQGLLLGGERKSIEPLSRRITLPDGRTSADPEQALQQFVNQSPWDHLAVLRRDRAHLAQTFASPKAFSSSMTPRSPSRARTPSAFSGSTAALGARRPTARSPSPSTTSAPKVTTPWTCNCTRPTRG